MAVGVEGRVARCALELRSVDKGATKEEEEKEDTVNLRGVIVKEEELRLAAEPIVELCIPALTTALAEEVFAVDSWSSIWWKVLCHIRGTAVGVLRHLSRLRISPTTPT